MSIFEQVRFTGGDWDGKTEWINNPHRRVIDVYAPPQLQSYVLTRANGRWFARYIPGSTRPAKPWLNWEE